MLYLIATPIGNLEDLSYRAIRILSTVDALACEDTRVTRRIFERYEIPSPKTILSYHEHNERSAGERLLRLLEEGCNIALCTDGGYPGISDPGYRIVSACVEHNIPIEVIPGPSAVPVALVSSGLPTSSYTFKGFPPRKPGPRKRFLEMESELPHTLVLFESPHRIGRLLEDALTVLGNRQAAVCIELTKKFESIRRGPLAELAEAFRDAKVRGEITVVIAGNHPKFRLDDPEAESRDGDEQEDDFEDDDSDTPESE